MCPLGGKIESEGKRERRELVRHHFSTTTASAEALSIWRAENEVRVRPLGHRLALTASLGDRLLIQSNNPRSYSTLTKNESTIGIRENRAPEAAFSPSAACSPTIILRYRRKGLRSKKE